MRIKTAAGEAGNPRKYAVYFGIFCRGRQRFFLRVCVWKQSVQLLAVLPEEGGRFPNAQPYFRLALWLPGRYAGLPPDQHRLDYRMIDFPSPIAG